VLKNILASRAMPGLVGENAQIQRRFSKLRAHVKLKTARRLLAGGMTEQRIGHIGVK
jgi:hypothetical protein